MTKRSERPSFDGVAKIVRFNWPFYALSCVGVVAAILLLNLVHLPTWFRLTLVFGAGIAAFWTLSSLSVSWYVYDHVGVTRWEWLRKRIPAPAHRWANIHAGLDESTSALRRLFPGTTGTVVDIYDSGEMTEQSIARARQIHPSSEPFKAGRFDALPVPNEDCDAVFLLFAAHEVRAVESRTLLLREAARVLKPKGNLVLVEHLRDWKNFLAFGPGFLHFHSMESWLNSIQDACLTIEQEFSVTPFVRCFVIRKAER